MKAVILAGGFGTRLTEETISRPKPMIDIGGKPILWHILKIYSHHGINEFIICCGYKGYVIKEYFANYFLHMSDVTFDMRRNSMEVHHRYSEPWRVTLVDTGESTMTGGRIRRVRQYVEGDDMFCLTYGDGLSDIDLNSLMAFHRAHGCKATLTAVHPPARFGVLDIDADRQVVDFAEKPRFDGGMINGGFFVLSPSVIDLIEDDKSVWERGPLERLAKAGELKAYPHDGFWQCMDTLRDKLLLDRMWASGSAPWKKWD